MKIIPVMALIFLFLANSGSSRKQKSWIR